MQFEKDETKNFGYIEDNGDNTCTMYINFPKYDVYQTILLEQPLESLVGLAEANPEIAEGVMQNMTTIPDDTEMA